MKNFLLLFYIVMFLFKTGNVLSNNSIFNVNNIQIDKKLYQNNENFLNIAFKKGFKKLTERILLSKDLSKVSNLSLEEIKDLVSYYQIQNDDKSKGLEEKFIKINLQFDREKLNNFFYRKNIFYSDLNKSEVVVFPLHVKNENIFIFDNNFFFKNWLINKKDNNNNDQIEYILPIESLEIIQTIKNNNENIELINVTEIIDDYKTPNKFFVVIFENNKNISIFVKGSIDGKKIVKNSKFLVSEFKSNNLYNSIIDKTKNIILEIIKSNNLIDVKTPAFLNLRLKIKKEMIFCS